VVYNWQKNDISNLKKKQTNEERKKGNRGIKLVTLDTSQGEQRKVRLIRRKKTFID